MKKIDWTTIVADLVLGGAVIASVIKGNDTAIYEVSMIFLIINLLKSWL